jgi:hypothetical protein
VADRIREAQLPTTRASYPRPTRWATRAGAVARYRRHPTLFAWDARSIPDAVNVFFPIWAEKGGSAREAAGMVKMGPMGTASNLSSTRRMIRALRRSERLTDAQCRAGDARVDDGAGAGRRGREHRATLRGRAACVGAFPLGALVTLPESETPDAIDRFLADLMRPSAAGSMDDDR